MTAPNLNPSSELTQRIHQAIAQAGGWIGFDRFMAMALYEPGLGYYTNALQKFGAMPSSGSDFVTAPGMSPLFGQTLAVQVRQALQATVVIVKNLHRGWRVVLKEVAIVFSFFKPMVEQISSSPRCFSGSHLSSSA